MAKKSRRIFGDKLARRWTIDVSNMFWTRRVNRAVARFHSAVKEQAQEDFDYKLMEAEDAGEGREDLKGRFHVDELAQEYAGYDAAKQAINRLRNVARMEVRCPKIRAIVEAALDVIDDDRVMKMLVYNRT